MKTTGSLYEEVINFHINKRRIDKAIAVALNGGAEDLSSHQWTNIIKGYTLNSICKVLREIGNPEIIKNFLNYISERNQINNFIIASIHFGFFIDTHILKKMVDYHSSEREQNSEEEILNAAENVNSDKLKNEWLELALEEAIIRGNIKIALKAIKNLPGKKLTKNSVECILDIFLSKINEKYEKETEDFDSVRELLNYCSTTEEKEFFMNLIF